jgi:hypothetical protein
VNLKLIQDLRREPRYTCHASGKESKNKLAFLISRRIFKIRKRLSLQKFPDLLG